jgi:oxidase EvaA
VTEAPAILSRGRTDAASRFTLSATAGDHTRSSLAAFHDWWDGRARANRFMVTQIPFAELDGWHFARDSGNIEHHSGRFFTVEGLQVHDGAIGWSQPIINQPEVGILGILVKEFDGVLHCLMQAKMEPGNVNTLQLSPTVQATRSNYTRVHRGTTTRYLEHFWGAGRGRVLVDSLQSEQGAWFWHKHNRNMVVEVTDDVPEHEDFHWLTLYQIERLLQVDNLVNMDARTVLACMPRSGPPVQDRAASPFTDALLRSYGAGGHDDAPSLLTRDEVLSWFTERKTRCEWSARLSSLASGTRWSRNADELADNDRQRFRVVAVRVRAGNREVTQWTQPLLAPRGEGLAVFLARPIDGVLHLLVQARPEPGLLDIVEMAPTIQLPPAVDTTSGLSTVDEPSALYLGTIDPAQIRFDALLSEEGGRFYHAQTRYQVIDVGPDFPVEVPENFCWVTVQQLTELLRHGHYLNVEARSLLACVHSLR